MTDVHAPDGLQIRDASFGYKTRSLGFSWHDVIQQVTIQVAPAECAVIEGGNGTGKTTLLRGMAGLLPPITGTVALSSKTPRQCRIAYLPQNVSTFPWKRAIHDAGLFLRAVGVARKKARSTAEAALQEMGLDCSPLTRCHSLSGGQKQKVSLARCLAVSDKVDLILLDEPTNSLDRETRSRFIQTLPDLLSRAPCPVVIVTHDDELSQRIKGPKYRIAQGRVVPLQMDEPKDP